MFILNLIFKEIDTSENYVADISIKYEPNMWEGHSLSLLYSTHLELLNDGLFKVAFRHLDPELRFCPLLSDE